MTIAGARVARPKVTVYFNQDVYDWLSEKADKEVRSVANLVEYLITKTKEEHDQEKEEK
jgi:hypothetical protein